MRCDTSKWRNQDRPPQLEGCDVSPINDPLGPRVVFKKQAGCAIMRGNKRKAPAAIRGSNPVGMTATTSLWPNRERLDYSESSHAPPSQHCEKGGISMKPQDKPYTMTIYQLRGLHRSMRKAGADVAAFDFVFEDVTSSVLFMTDVAPFRLVFYKRSSKERLEIEVVPGYMIRLTQSREAEIRRYFEMPTGGWQSMLFKRLADALRAQTPVEFVPPRASGASSSRKPEKSRRRIKSISAACASGRQSTPGTARRNGTEIRGTLKRPSSSIRESIEASKTGTYPYAIPMTPPGP